MCKAAFYLSVGFFNLIYRGTLTTAFDHHDGSAPLFPPPTGHHDTFPDDDSHMGDDYGFSNPADQNGDMSDNNDEQLVSCVYYRHDHNTQQTDVMLCEHGCCGTLDDQKCCKDPDHEFQRGISVPLIILLVVIGLLTIVIVILIVTCVCKHKQSVNKRQTSPAHIWYTGGIAPGTPYNLFYTKEVSKCRKNEKTPQTFTEILNESLADMRPTSPPPRYSERENETETEVPPSLNENQPPPYLVAVASMPPSATEL